MSLVLYFGIFRWLEILMRIIFSCLSINTKISIISISALKVLCKSKDLNANLSDEPKLWPQLTLNSCLSWTIGSDGNSMCYSECNTILSSTYKLSPLRFPRSQKIFYQRCTWCLFSSIGRPRCSKRILLGCLSIIIINVRQQQQHTVHLSVIYGYVSGWKSQQYQLNEIN